ncbi:MAG: diguanylate cyclase, partial [Candidatus Aminicenantaceae bacterium]
VNQAVSEATGYAPSELMGRDFRIFLDKKSQLFVSDRYKRRQRGEEVPPTYEFHAITKDGRKRLMEAFSTILKDDEQNVQTVAYIRDITERKEMEEALRTERNQLEELHKAVDRIQKCDTEEELYKEALSVTGNILQFDHCTLYSLEGDILVPKAYTWEALPEGLKPHPMDEGIAGLTFREGRSVMGEDLKKWKEAKPSRDDIKSFMSVPIGKFGVLQAFSQHKRNFSQQDLNLAKIFAGHLGKEIARMKLEKKLREQAVRDSLTGLFNRRFFNQSIKKELARCKRYDSCLALLMIDINRFKEINDRYSHMTGDKILKEIGGLLKENVRETDTVVRYGGDEFLIIMPETNGDTEQLIFRIRKKIEEWNQKQNLLDFPLTLAIGSSFFKPGTMKELDALLKEADSCMYEDKRKMAR